MPVQLKEDHYPSRVAADPKWISRREPAIHSEWNANAPLSRSQHDAFARDGFLVLEDVFAAAEISSLQEELERLRGGAPELDAETIIREPGGDAIRSVFAVHRQSELFSRLAADARLVDVARHLVGDNVYMHQSRLNYKPGFSGKEFYWHSDFETWHTEDGMPAMRAVSISILLTSNRPENGPLMLMPGSHKHFISCIGETPEDHYRKSLRKQEYGVPDSKSLTRLSEMGDIQAPVGPAGSVVIFDCNTMHGSNGNITPWPRANAFYVYNSVSNTLRAPYCAEKPRPEFIAARNDTRPLRSIAGRIGARERAA